MVLTVAQSQYWRGQKVICADGALHLVWSVGQGGIVHVIPCGGAAESGNWKVHSRRHFMAGSLVVVGQVPPKEIAEIEELIRLYAKKIEDTAIHRRLRHASNQVRRRRVGRIQSSEYR